jgi:hypothetical protein
MEWIQHSECQGAENAYVLQTLFIPVWVASFQFAVLQFQHTVQQRMEDPVKMKQEYMLLAIISHIGDTPNCGRYSN